MALKKEQSQVSYSSQIGVNRGTGYQSLANAYKQQANVVDNLVNAYASKALDEMKIRGKKIGQEAAENVNFVEEVVSWKDPLTGNQDQITVRKPISDIANVFSTRTAQEAYDDMLAKRYIQEAQVSAENIINQEKALALSNNLSEAQYDVLVRNKLDKLYKVLPTDVGNYVETYSEERRQEGFYTVMTNYDRHLKQLENTNVKNTYTKNTTLLAEGLITKEEFDENVAPYKNSEYYKTNSELLENAVNTAIYTNDTLASIRVDDWTKASMKDLNTLSTNLTALNSVALGSASSATLMINGNPQTITREDLVRNLGTLDEINTWQNSVSEQLTRINSYLSSQTNNANIANIIKANVKSFHESGTAPILYGETRSKVEDWFGSFDSQEDIAELYQARYGTPIRRDGNAVDGPLNSFDVTRLAIDNGVLPTNVKNTIQSNFGTFNPSGIQNLYQSGIIDYITNSQIKIPRTVNKTTADGGMSVEMEYDTVYTNRINELGLSNETVQRIKFVDDRIDAGYSIDDIASQWERRSAEKLTMERALEIYGGGKYDTRAKFYNEIRKSVDKVSKELLGHDPNVLLFNAEIIDLFETDYIDDVRSGIYLSINKDSINKAARNFMTRLIGTNNSETTSQYGYSSAMWSERLGVFDTNNREVSFGTDTKLFTKFPPENYYSLGGEVQDTWIDSYIHDVINEQSKEVNDPGNIYNGVRIDNTWGKVGQGDMVLRQRLRLVPIDDMTPPIYNVVFMGDNGVIHMLHDKDTDIPLEIDLQQEYLDRGKKMIEEDIDRKRKIDMDIEDGS